MYVATVDGIHCRIWEPRKFPSTKWYSHKHKQAGLTYEIAVCIHHNAIAFMSGPFPASVSDKMIFDRPGGLASKLKDHQKVVADQGYVGTEKAATRNEFDSPEVKKFKGRAKARQETINARLKAFGVLNQNFRTPGKLRLPRHKACMEACCVIVQYELENNSPLFEI